MILIASAAYVNAEFQIEFGKLPPALLPVGNRRLFEHQVETLRREFPEQKIYLSLPESYYLCAKDTIFLERESVRIIRSSESLDLAASIEHAIANSIVADEDFRLLHGDTWLRNVPKNIDCIGLVETNEDYSWEVENVDLTSESVWCGYFAFSSVQTLRKSLTASEGNFADAVRLYDAQCPLQRILVEGWHDFGHVNTYFRSRAKLTTERTFNELIIFDGCVRKTGRPFEKITAELDWFKFVPPQLRVFIPQVIDHGVEDGDRPFYVLEYLPLPPLNEVYVHGQNPVFYWDKIFALCADFLEKCGQHQILPAELARITENAVAMAGSKTWRRLAEYFAFSGHPGLDVPSRINGIAVPSLREIVNDCHLLLEKTRPVPGVLHGDLCLSNILFDSRSDRIKVIDPRGLDANGEQSALGDLRYDVAKLAHSIIGLYDFIIAGAYSIDYSFTVGLCIFELDIHIDERTQSIQKVFLDRRFLGLEVRHIIPLTILLFLSMLPLHSDSVQRQNALLANALRLYAELKCPRRLPE